MKKTFLLFFLITLIGACKKTDRLPNESKNGKQKNITSSKAAGDGLWDLLGYGYDVTGEFANSESATWPIIDIEKFKLDYPTYIDASGAETGTHVYESGQDARDFTQKITGKIGLTGGDGFLFKGTIDLNFSSDNKWSNKYIYANYSIIATKKRLKLLKEFNILKNYLHLGFLNHLQTMSPQQLVSTYGTHILFDIKLGGKLELIYQAETTSSNRILAANAGSKFSFFKIFGLNTEGSYNSTDYSSNFNEKAFVRTVGGNAAAGLINTVTFNSSGNPNITFNPTAWSTGVTDANAELIDIPANGLVPIYELVDDPIKKNALLNYISQYLNDNKTILRTAMHRYFQAQTVNHYYAVEYIPSGFGSLFYQYEGIEFHVPQTQISGSVPIQRYWNSVKNNHYYEQGSPRSISGYIHEGVKFYAFPNQVNGTIPIYRYYHPSAINHYYSNTYLTISGYNYEGIAFYAYPN